MDQNTNLGQEEVIEELNVNSDIKEEKEHDIIDDNEDEKVKELIVI